MIPRDVRVLPTADLIPVTLVFTAGETELKPGPSTDRRLSLERRTVPAVATCHRVDRPSLPKPFHLAEAQFDGGNDPGRHVSEQADGPYGHTLILGVSLPSIRDRLGIPKGVGMKVEVRDATAAARALLDELRKKAPKI